MNKRNLLYHGYRFPSEIISHAVWLYHRYCLSFRDVEDLLAERGIVVSYETIRNWCNKFGPAYARAIKKRRGTLGDTWYMDEVYIVTVQVTRPGTTFPGRSQPGSQSFSRRSASSSGCQLSATKNSIVRNVAAGDVRLLNGNEPMSAAKIANIG